MRYLESETDFSIMSGSNFPAVAKSGRLAYNAMSSAAQGQDPVNWK
jgi:hypothetical protein